MPTFFYPSSPADYVGFLVTGQSLGSGEQASKYVSTRQVYGNLQLQDSLENSLDGGGGDVYLTQLSEPLRPLPQYGQYNYEHPRNISGETPCSGFANQLSKSLGWTCIAHNVAVPVHSIAQIKKNGTGSSYAASIAEITAAKALADSEGKTYGVFFIILVHGEADENNSGYAAAVEQLRADYDADIKAITGQTQDVVMLISQQCSLPYSGSTRSYSTLAAQELMESDPEHFIALSKTHFEYQTDHIHLNAASERRLGEQAAHAVINRVRGKIAALRPLSASLNGNQITIEFEVPVTPLQFTETISAHQGTTQWASGKGFEVEDSGGKITISDVSIDGSNVVITCASNPGSGARVSCGMYQDSDGYHAGTTSGRRVLLCDSDNFDGESDERILCNVVENYTHITAVDHQGMHDRAAFEFVSGSDLPAGTYVQSITDIVDTGCTQKRDVVLSEQWGGGTRTAALWFRNDHRNYCIQFSILL